MYPFASVHILLSTFSTRCQTHQIAPFTLHFDLYLSRLITEKNSDVLLVSYTTEVQSCMVTLRIPFVPVV